MKFNHFIWDFDGTLFNTYPSIVQTIIVVAKKSFKKELHYEKVKELCQKSLIHCLNQVSKELNIKSEILQELFSREYTKIKESEQPPFNGTLEILELIKKKGGKNYIFTHRGKLSLNKLIKYYKVNDLFEHIITNEDKFQKKPDPSAILYLIERYQIPKPSLLLIGDRDIDIQAAKAINIKSCYFNTEGLNHPLSDFNIQNLVDLKRFNNL